MMWQRLWTIATSEPEGIATITPTENPSEVLLTWPDGSCAYYAWDHRTHDWDSGGEHNACPGDVAARDSL
jgi:hypothetical protein